MTLNYLANVHHLLGRVDEAIASFHEAIDMHQELGSRWARARPLNNLGLTYAERGWHDQARQCFEEALVLTEEADDRSAMAYALTNLARLCRDTAQDRDALKYAERARIVAQENRMPGAETLVLEVLGVVNRRLGNVQQAIAHHEQCLAFAIQIGDPTTSARAHNGLAEAHAAVSAPSEAGNHFRQALAADPHGSNRDVRFEHARAHTGLGDLHATLDQHDTATEHWQHALEIYRDLQAPEADAVAAKLPRISGSSR